MNIEYNLVSLIDVLGLTQGLLLGTILILSTKKNRPSLFLGLFLITYSIELISAIVNDTGIVEQYPALNFLPVNFFFASMPLLYLYAKSLMAKVNLKQSLLILIPGFLEFAGFSFMLFTPTSWQEGVDSFLEENFISVIYWFGGMAYSMFFACLIIFRINKHQSQIENYYSEIQQKHLRWLTYVAVFSLVFFISLILYSFILNSETVTIMYPVISVINVFFIYWVGLYGFRQSRVEVPLMIENGSAVSKDNSDNWEKEYQDLLTMITSKKNYINPDLTLADLAEAINLTPKRLSQLINLKSGVNFNRFINQYRVNAAKAMLKDPAYAHLSVVGIGYEVGFNSKASFYSVFKSLAHTTPAQFKKQT